RQRHATSYSKSYRARPKRMSYPTLPYSLDDIFTALMAHKIINLPPSKEHCSPHPDHARYCLYHRAHGHLLATCFTFRDWIHDMNQAGRINWANLRETIADLRRSPPPSPLSNDSNSVLDDRGQQSDFQDSSSSSNQEQVSFIMADQPIL